MDSEDGPAWAGEKLGPSLLGFHGIEYILYANGNVKSASQITNNELIYAVAVAGDLRNQCIRLEADWVGLVNVSTEKQELIEEFELGVTMGNKLYYGADMINAGSTFRTILDANEAIIEATVYEHRNVIKRCSKRIDGYRPNDSVFKKQYRLCMCK